MDETIQLPRTRRRSSILPRRSIAPPIIHDSHISGDTSSQASEPQTAQIQPPSDDAQKASDGSYLPSAIIELKAELDTWKNLRSERKLLKHSENRKTKPEISWESAVEFLSAEDIAILQNGPPLGKIQEDYDRLVKEAAFLRNKYDRIVHLTSGIKRLVQSRFDTIKKDIGVYSEKSLDLQGLV